MKRLLFLSFLIVPLFADAQQLELSVNAGLCTTTLTTVGSWGVVDPGTQRLGGNKNEGAKGYAFSVKAAKRLNKKWQVGAGVEVDEIKAKAVNTIIFTKTGKDEGNFELATPAIVPHVFINRMIPVCHGSLYLGARLGVLFAVNRYKSDNETTVYGSGEGYMLGLQAGYIIYISKRVGLNAEIAPGLYGVLNHGNNHSDIWGNMTVPFTLGVKYKI